ncbi:MAG: ABC transporter permease [Clostridiales bacterium]|jgi:ribose transport system permease protein|nr:ABC transporter permease [Clostridiales bacterium]
MRRVLRGKSREIILILVLVAIGAVVRSIMPSFLSKINIVNILYGNAVLGIMAMGMMMVLVTGNVDVSAGGQYAVCGMVVAMFVRATGGLYTVPAILIGMATGLVLGLFNGILVSKLRIPAIVVTLGTLNIMRGTLNLITSGNWIDGLKGPFSKFANIRWMSLPLAVYIWLFVLLFTYFLLYRTGMGRDILAVGGNKVAARRIGLNESKAYLVAFGYMGMLTGLSAAIACSKLKIAQPSNGTGYEMQLIAACVIGGTAFSGGIASILGTLLGILLLGVIDNGLVLSKVPVYWQELTTGVIIILAVASGVLKNFGRRAKGGTRHA